MKISKEELSTKYFNMTNKALAEELRITTKTLLTYLEKAKIPRKGKGNRTKKSKVTVI